LLPTAFVLCHRKTLCSGAATSWQRGHGVKFERLQSNDPLTVRWRHA